MRTLSSASHGAGLPAARQLAALQDSRHALTNAYTECRRAAAGLSRPNLVQERAGKTRSRHAERVADGYRATVRVDARGRELELAHAGEALGSKGLIRTDPDNRAQSQDRGLSAGGRFASLPVLIVVGDQDVPEIVQAAHEMARQAPNARLAMIEGAAHLPNVERARAFDAILRPRRGQRLRAPAAPACAAT